MKRSILFPDEMYKDITQISKETGITRTAIVILACGELIKKFKKENALL